VSKKVEKLYRQIDTYDSNLIEIDMNEMRVNDSEMSIR